MKSSLIKQNRKFILFFTLAIVIFTQSAPRTCSAQVEMNENAEIIGSKTIPSIPALARSEAGKVLLEKKIDPKTYILGPGDILSIFTWGNFQGQYRLTVSPEGVLLIPEVGPVDVSGVTIEKASDIIISSILKRYRNVETIVSLVDLRTFKVYIGGAVRIPGAYPATAATRVSELINTAGGFLGVDEDANFPIGPRLIQIEKKLSSKRNVLIYRQDGDTLKADILRFEISGGTQYDPTLLDGDRIFVPLRENSVNIYGIFGAVRNPGYFEYSDNDSLADLIELAHGLNSSADSANVTIIRFKPDHRQTFENKLDLRTGGWNIRLNPDDRVFITEESDFNEKYQVELRGEFKYRGYYAISLDSTRLSEIIVKAGGLTEYASPEEAEMIRVSAEEIVDPEYERLKEIQVADMLEGEYDYFRTKSRSKPGRVAVDFVGLIINGDSSKDMILRDGDIINVPRKSKVINVIGEVSNPGIQSHVSSADYRHYLREAGGFSDRANKGKVTIIKGITSEWKKAKKGTPLEPGDTIWIPEKKKRSYFALTKDILIFVGNLATVYLVVRQASL